MYKHGTQLVTDADFDNAINFGYIVSITQNGEHLGSGHILSHSKNVIKMIDAYYFKYSCDFTVCLLTKVKILPY